MSKIPRTGSLVLYKSGPAIVNSVSDKIEVLMLSGKNKRVRPKDVELLHLGPIGSLAALGQIGGDLGGEVEEAWELLIDEDTISLNELAELSFGEYTPRSAWAAWRLVDDGLWFEGRPGEIKARPRHLIDDESSKREAKAAEKSAWSDFLERLRNKKLLEQDHAQLAEVEQLALHRSSKSRILLALKKQEKPEVAHKFLVDTGYWPEEYNPYPSRLELSPSNPDLPVPKLAEVERLDLTHLQAFAIDDEGSNDPDDAISLDGERIWIHIADVAGIAPPDSALDLEARNRAANLYLPDRIIHMLPPTITDQLALGLQEVSPALSFGFYLNDQAEVTNLEIHLSKVRVTRHTYASVNEQIGSKPFVQLLNAAERFRQRRISLGAAQLELPEARVRVSDGEISIVPMERLHSREMVTELMLMAGEGAAQFALQHDIPVPFATQPPPEKPSKPKSLSEMFAYRRLLKPGRHHSQPEPHSGLGLKAYIRATSPLRRYHDLVVHQQLRAHLLGENMLSIHDISDRIAAISHTSGLIRKAERLSNLHWKLLFLKRNPKWQGKAIVVERDEQRALLAIPELAMETRMRFNSPPMLDSELNLAIRDLDLASLTAWFRLVS